MPWLLVSETGFRHCLLSCWVSRYFWNGKSDCNCCLLALSDVILGCCRSVSCVSDSVESRTADPEAFGLGQKKNSCSLEIARSWKIVWLQRISGLKTRSVHWGWSFRTTLQGEEKNGRSLHDDSVLVFASRLSSTFCQWSTSSLYTEFWFRVLS